MMRVSSYLKTTLYIMSSIYSCAYSVERNKYDRRIGDAGLETEAKHTTENMVEIYSSADHMALTSTPYVIALLGQLMLLTTENDFSLTDNPPIEGFKYIKYPKSFRATIVQLTNIGLGAFNKAHINMDSINRHTTNIQHYVQTLTKILDTGSTEEIEALVPITMAKIERIVNECVTLSKSVENKFDYFTEVISELLEASTSAKTVYDDKVQETERVIQATKLEKQNTLLEKQKLEQHFDRIQKEMHNAQEMFGEAVTDMPSTWKLLGLKLLDTISLNAIHTIIFGRNNVVEQFLVKEESESEEDIARKYAYGFADDIQQHLQTLVDVATSGKEKGDKEPNWNDIESVHSSKHNFLVVKGNLERDELRTDVHEQGIELCDKAIQLSEQLIELSKNLSPDKKVIQTVIMNVEDLLIMSKEYASKSDAFVFNKGFRTRWSSSTFSSGFAESEIKKAEMKVEVTKDILQDTRKKQEDSIHRIRKNNERMEATLKQLANAEISKINFKEIRILLSKGLEALSDVRKEWGQVVRYFQSLSKIVKIHLTEYIDDLSDYTDLGLSQISKKDKISELTRGLVSKQIHIVKSVLHVVRELSSIYVEISAKYLIDEINSLGRLAALNPKTDSKEIEMKRNELLESASNAQKDITHKITQKRKQVTQELEKEMKQMH